MTGTSRVVEGNGWDAVALDPGATLTIPTATTGPIDLEIRLLTPATRPGDRPDPVPTPRRRHDHRPDGDAGPRRRLQRRHHVGRPAGRRPAAPRGDRPDHRPVGDGVRARPRASRRAGRWRRRPTMRSSGSDSREAIPPPSARVGLALDRAPGARRVALEGVGARRPAGRRRPATDRRGRAPEPRHRGRLGRPLVEPACRRRASRAGPAADPDDRLRQHHQQHHAGLGRRARPALPAPGAIRRRLHDRCRGRPDRARRRDRPARRQRREHVADVRAPPPGVHRCRRDRRGRDRARASSTGRASARRR